MTAATKNGSATREQATEAAARYPAGFTKVDNRLLLRADFWALPPAAIRTYFRICRAFDIASANGARKIEGVAFGPAERPAEVHRTTFIRARQALVAAGFIEQVRAKNGAAALYRPVAFPLPAAETRPVAKTRQEPVAETLPPQSRPADSPPVAKTLPLLKDKYKRLLKTHTRPRVCARDRFQEFQEEYPSHAHGNLTEARQLWEFEVGEVSEERFREMIANLESWKRLWARKEARYTTHLSRFLRERRFEQSARKEIGDDYNSEDFDAIPSEAAWCATWRRAHPELTNSEVAEHVQRMLAISREHFAADRAQVEQLFEEELQRARGRHAARRGNGSIASVGSVLR